MHIRDEAAAHGQDIAVAKPMLMAAEQAHGLREMQVLLTSLRRRRRQAVRLAPQPKRRNFLVAGPANILSSARDFEFTRQPAGTGCNVNAVQHKQRIPPPALGRVDGCDNTR
jgi:hypothetical protein